MSGIKKVIVCFALVMMSALTGCEDAEQTNESTQIDDVQQESDSQYAEEQEMTFKMITMDEAAEIFQTPGDYIIVDVRKENEYAGGHIPGAIHIANESISDEEIPLLPNKEQTIYVYCRSGNRSKLAAHKLVKLGYTNIIEFGGILDWNGEIVR